MNATSQCLSIWILEDNLDLTSNRFILQLKKMESEGGIGFPIIQNQSVPMKPFVSLNGVKAKKWLSVIYMEPFWAFPDPQDNLLNHTK